MEERFELIWLIQNEPSKRVYMIQNESRNSWSRLYMVQNGAISSCFLIFTWFKMMQILIYITIGYRMSYSD